MKKNSFLARTFVLMAVFTLALAGCDNKPTTTQSPDPVAVPNTIKAVIGYGYDITGRYAYSPDIKAAILDMDKLLDAKRIKEDPQFKTRRI